MIQLDYIPGKCLTGTERRAEELDYKELRGIIGMEMHLGTFNVQLDADLPFGRLAPPFAGDKYRLFMCGVGTPQLVRDSGMPVPGWILREADSDVPNHFIEVVSIFNIREQLKIEKWPSAKVVIALELGDW